MKVLSGANAGSLLAGVLLVLAAIVVAAQLDVTTDISAFLPTGSDREQARLSRAVARGEASRTIILTIDAGDEPVAEVSRVFEQELRRDEDLVDALSFLELGPPENIDGALWELYQPRRLAFAAANEDDARAMVTDTGLRHAAGEIRRRLESPLSTMVTRVAPEDPLLSLPRLFERLQSGRSDGLATVEGRFVAQQRFAVVLLGTRASAFDAPSQRVVFEGVQAAHARLAARMQVGPLESSGLGRYSIKAEETIKGDIRRTTVLSVLGLCLLCLLVLRSFRIVLVAAVPVGSAVLVATAVSLLLYGRVHGLTLAFGGALVGVCVDYSVHLYVHHSMDPAPGGARQTLGRIWPALLLGATTTGAGFAVIAGSSFPGLRQVAIFATVGVTTALLTTGYLLPPMLGTASRSRVAARDGLSALLLAIFGRLHRHPRASWGMLVGACVVSTWGLQAVHWQDDLQSMGRLDSQMIAEDERVRARVARFEQGRFVIAVAATEAEALEVNDAIAAELSEATTEGEVGAWHSVATMLPSPSRQRRVEATIRDATDLRPRTEAALAAAGFNEQMFEPFFAHLDERPATPLTYADLESSPAAPLVRSLRMDVDGRVGFITLMRDVRDSPAIAARVETIPGAVYLDQTELMASAMEQYRRRTTQLLLVGLLAVTAILAVRYRSARIVGAIMAPAVLAAGVTMATLAATGRSVDVIGLTALLMILSIGVDYGVFLAEVRNEGSPALGAALLGLVVCWASTVLGFGVLAISEHPTMKMIGIVVGVGVTASLVLAPTTIALLPAGPRRPT